MAERTNLTSASSQNAGQNAGAERTAEEIRQNIAARRESITEAVDRLSDRFQRTLDWRAYISDYPLVALGVAAGLGFFAARIFRPRPSAGKRIMDALNYGIEELADRFQYKIESVASPGGGFGLSKTVKAAATGAITKAVTDYLRNRFAGHYERYPEYGSEYVSEYESEYEPRYEKNSERRLSRNMSIQAGQTGA